MGQALYRQYRPKTLDEVVGQDHITTTLKNALKSGRISHAYLFTGPRGVGKTSIARILAHEVNAFPYDETSNQLDIIEIDAASNRRIDEIRDLRDKVHIAPTSGKYKVYIIDEVHMLTKEAFNALLKTLEEPPAHVIFILATTEAHKLPETIISRTQRFSFRPIDLQPLIGHLKTIAKKEKIQIDDEALKLIAEHSEGSFRDSISLLDQASSVGNKISLAEVQQMLGLAPDTAIQQLLKDLTGDSAKDVLHDLTGLEEQGYQPASVAKQIGSVLRSDLVTGQSLLGADTTLQLLGQLINVPASTSPDKLLEIILLDIVLKRQGSPQPADVAAPSKEIKQPTPKAEPQPAVKVETPKAVQVESEATNNSAESQTTEQFNLEDWSKILDDVKVRHNTLYGILRMANPAFNNDKLILSFKFAFHQKRINQPKMHQLISETFSRLGIEPVSIEAIVDSSLEEPAENIKPVVDVSAISNIFGDAEVLES
ncbi:MAG: DNA polymerase III subunit gamma/tau [Candidatus Saccharimonadales bacterium]